MKKCSFMGHTVILLSLTIAFYHTQQWKTKQRAILKELYNTIENDYVEKSNNLFNALRDNIVRTVKDDVLPSLLDELVSQFSPNQIQEYQLESDLENALCEEVQQNVTMSLRTLIKKDISSAMKEIGTEKGPKKVIKKYPTNLCSADKKLPPNQKILSYALYGMKQFPDKDLHELMDQILASNLYHTWRVRIYHDGSFEPHILEKYKAYKTLDFCDARKIPQYGDITNRLGKVWRNIPLGDESVDVICPRHINSTILTREEDAVGKFINSDKLLHVMRDHPSHKSSIVDNTWCMRTVGDPHRGKVFLKNLLKRALSEKTSTEEILLLKVVWNGFGKKDKYIMQHDSFSCSGEYKDAIPFPTQRRDNREFVGCSKSNCNSENMMKCPKNCRPVDHQDWEYC